MSSKPIRMQALSPRSSMLLICGLLLPVLLTGCIYKIVTVPVGIAYKTTKVAVKGTAMVVGAVIPDGEDAKTDQADKDQ